MMLLGVQCFMNLFGWICCCTMLASAHSCLCFGFLETLVLMKKASRRLQHKQKSVLMAQHCATDPSKKIHKNTRHWETLPGDGSGLVLKYNCWLTALFLRMAVSKYGKSQLAYNARITGTKNRMQWTHYLAWHFPSWLANTQSSR